MFHEWCLFKNVKQHKTANNKKQIGSYNELICILMLNTARLLTVYLTTSMQVVLQSDRILCYSLSS